MVGYLLIYFFKFKSVQVGSFSLLTWLLENAFVKSQDSPMDTSTNTSRGFTGCTCGSSCGCRMP
jgi:hypothetical protein